MDLLKSITDALRLKRSARKPSAVISVKSDDLPLRQELFSIDQMKQHGHVLAGMHTIMTEHFPERLLSRLNENEDFLMETRDLLTADLKSEHWISPGGEWLLDNFYLIEEQIRMAKRHLPVGYSRELPHLANGPSKGLPRVYDIALEIVAHGDGQVHPEGLNSFIEAYQTITPLKLGELWAIPIMLRLALIENLRRVAAKIAAAKKDRNLADSWAQDMIRIVEKDPKGLVLMIADMARSSPPKTSAFVAECARRLRGQNPSLALPLTWMELWLSESNMTIEQMVQMENQKQAADQVSISNSIQSLRLLTAMDWRHFVESRSLVEQTLRQDPAGIYSQMDFQTRDMYRHAIEEMALHSPHTELEVAQKAVFLSQETFFQNGADSRTAHIGYYLIDQGRAKLEQSIHVRLSAWEGVRRAAGHIPLVIYLGAILALSSTVTVAVLWMIGSGLHYGLTILLGVLSGLASSQLSFEIINCVAALLVKPKCLPSLDYSRGIAPWAKTLVVVPAMLKDLSDAAHLIESLEVRFLANRDERLFFGLLTDYCDSSQEKEEYDESLLEAVRQGIEVLNSRYKTDGRDIFYLFHRPRQYNAQDKVWMGYERKRGKLSALNALLRGHGREHFSLIVGNLEDLVDVKYVITLDTDTHLPRDTARRMIAAMAHPLNRPVFDETRKIVTYGYGILQPRVSMSLPGSGSSWYGRLFGGETGIDPYTRAVSDVYQDVFAEGSFIGKGIYDIDAFEKTLGGRFPDNKILSHDLLEGSYARCGLLSDVELYEEYPTAYICDIRRRHRWIRGDWQLLGWLKGLVPIPGGKEKNPLSKLSQWKIIDNLRRSLVPAAWLGLFILGWTVFSHWPWWTAAVLAAWFIPAVMVSILEIFRKSKDMTLYHHLGAVVRNGFWRIGQSLFALFCLPFEAIYFLDAIVRTIGRMAITHKKLLDWNSWAHDNRQETSRLSVMYQNMRASSVVVLGLLLYALAAQPPISWWMWSIAGAWFLAPVAAWLLSMPIAKRAVRLTDHQRVFLRKLSRKTWSFFEDFVGPEDNWLPPDNYQEQREELIAHRTSPTNIGLALLSNVSAFDFGYITASTLIGRTQKTLTTMQHLRKYRGHLFNWYDTKTLKPLMPAYISTVDSGNLAAHLLTLRMGLLSLKDEPVVSKKIFEGLRDTLMVLIDAADKKYVRSLVALEQHLNDGCQTPLSHPKAINYLEGFLKDLPADLEQSFGAGSPGLRLSRSLRNLCQDWLLDLKTLPEDFPEGGTWGQLAERSLPGDSAKKLLETAEYLAAQAQDMAAMDYEFLYDKNRCLLSIGYNVDEHRLDASCYDLLASEARLASFVGIAQGKLPQENWFALGRLITTVGGDPILMSWSGSMFEYLMPLLVMPTFENTLLDRTYQVVIKRQMEYGRQRNVPWGISESCYNTIDVNFNYQYKAFGVPGIGFKRRLVEDLVVAPYATMLALMVNPEAACQNLQQLEAEGAMGAYGFFEAIDYTPSRQRRGEHKAVLHTFLAHHQGMGLLSLAYLLLDKPMQKRFNADPLFQATMVLLQERIPKAIPYYAHVSEFSRVQHSSADLEIPVRALSGTDTVVPEVQLLSNGRYHVMITNAGGGYSRWKNQALTRWREDSVCDNWGSFCYIRDLSLNQFWSNTYQPTLKKASKYEAIFVEGRAEFRRRDHHIDTYTEIAVSPEDDIELRRVRITNRSRAKHSIDVTSYAEIVLASQASDQLHPAFGNLFIQTEIIEDKKAILATRRPRSPEEQPLWMFHLMTVHEAAVQDVSFETDRAKFIGRGNSIVHPAAMNQEGRLSGTQGPVLDPVASIRSVITLEPEQSIIIDIVSGVGQSRDAALALVDKYCDRRIAERVFELAWAHSQVLLRQINATESDAQLYTRLANSILYANNLLRPEEALLNKLKRGQSSLWGYAISGDLPIVLLEIEDASNIHLVKQLVQAHAYWRLKGLAVDLVIWNEGQDGYQQNLQEQIMGLIAASVGERSDHQRGDIFVRHVEQISNEDRVLFQAIARAIITDRRGMLASQLNRKVNKEPPEAFIPFVNHHPKPIGLTPGPHRELLFFNGLGGFSADGSEYVITLLPGQVTPAPWVNVLANPNFGTVVSENGAGYTWAENAHEYRLTPWSNDPVNDNAGEAFYLRDEESGYFWSPSPKPVRGQQPYIIRHGFGYSVFEYMQDGIRSQLWIYVSLDCSVKFSVLKVKNESGRPRRLSATGYVEWVLGDVSSKTGMHIQTERDPASGTVYARNLYNSEFPDRIGFFHVNDLNHTCTNDRAEFLGRNGNVMNPAAMGYRNLSGKKGSGLNPCSALQVPFDLAPGGEREIVFTLGLGRDLAEIKGWLHRFRGIAGARYELEAVRHYWKHTLSAVQVETPDVALNVLANGWLLYQTIACRMWARSATYQSGGAFGFRDQLQDVMALLYTKPRMVRDQLLLCAAHQFEEGDVLHWWHPPQGRGVRTKCSDDFLWLPLVTSRYVHTTADDTILDEKVEFIRGRHLNLHEESYYDMPVASEQSASLYEHCKRAVLFGLKFGPHGLPLIGSGDWNDGMNWVGMQGKGESVWLAFFLYEILNKFAVIASSRSDMEFSRQCQSEAQKLRANIESKGWDGEWYLRAFFDDGTPLGSSKNDECRIDALAQCWSVLSGAGSAEHTRRAMQSLDRYLIRRKDQLILLLDPPFDKSALNPGYIKGYVPGVRENGGQYTHAAIWVAMAFARMKDCEKAWEAFSMINPIAHGKSPEMIAAYKVEPYVACADVYGCAPHTGRGGWTWYTGSAGMMYRLIVESILGLKQEGERLYIDPCMPKQWKAFKLHYRYRETFYHISVARSDTPEGRTIVTENGQVKDGDYIVLADDRREHMIQVHVPHDAFAQGLIVGESQK